MPKIINTSFVNKPTHRCILQLERGTPIQYLTGINICDMYGLTLIVLNQTLHVLTSVKIFTINSKLIDIFFKIEEFQLIDWWTINNKLAYFS